MRGRKADPTALKRRKGNPGKRALPKGEPEPAVDRGRPPSWLDKYAKEAWNELVPALRAQGLFTVMDRTAMVVLCTHLSMWRQAVDVVIEKGSVLGHMGTFEARKQAEVVHRLLAAFGFTPSDRVRLGVSRGRPGEALAKWFEENKPGKN